MKKIILMFLRSIRLNPKDRLTPSLLCGKLLKRLMNNLFRLKRIQICWIRVLVWRHKLIRKLIDCRDWLVSGRLVCMRKSAWEKSNWLWWGKGICIWKSVGRLKILEISMNGGVRNRSRQNINLSFCLRSMMFCIQKNDPNDLNFFNSKFSFKKFHL